MPRLPPSQEPEAPLIFPWDVALAVFHRCGDERRRMHTTGPARQGYITLACSHCATCIEIGVNETPVIIDPDATVSISSFSIT